MKKKKVITFGPPPVSAKMPTPQPIASDRLDAMRHAISQSNAQYIADRSTAGPVTLSDVVAQQYAHEYPGQWLAEADYRWHRRNYIDRVQASRERHAVLTRSEEMTAQHGTESELRSRLTELRREVLAMDGLPRTASIDFEFRRKLALIEMIEHRLRDFAPPPPPPPTLQQEIQAIQQAPWPGDAAFHRILDGLLTELDSLHPGSSHYTRKEAILNAWEQKHARFRQSADDDLHQAWHLHAEPYRPTNQTAQEVQATERHQAALRNRFIEDYQSFNQAVLDQAISDAAANGLIAQAFFTPPASRPAPLTQQDVDFYRAGMSATPPPPPRNPPPPLRSLTPLPRAIVRD